MQRANVVGSGEVQRETTPLSVWKSPWVKDRPALNMGKLISKKWDGKELNWEDMLKVHLGNNPKTTGPHCAVCTWGGGDNWEGNSFHVFVVPSILTFDSSVTSWLYLTGSEHLRNTSIHIASGYLLLQPHINHSPTNKERLISYPSNLPKH